MSRSIARSALAVSLLSPLCAQSLVRDIDPSRSATSFDSNPRGFAPVGGRYMFAATVNGSPSLGTQLFVTDGTPAGTEMISRAHPVGDPIQPALTNGAELNGIRYFRCHSLLAGTEVWRSDGTLAGTGLCLDLVVGGSSWPEHFATAGGRLFFTATSPATGIELWVSDGTVAGTSCLDIVPGWGHSRPGWLTPFGGRLVFRADGEPWISDGTAAGTLRLADIHPGPGFSYPSEFTEFNGRLYFSASDPAGGYELWETDGTTAGTRRAIDLRPGAGDAQPQGLTVAGNSLFFTADDGVVGRELWKTGGTAASTVLVRDIEPGAAGSDPRELTALGGRVLFRAAGATGGAEPWVSDGTAAGTLQLADLAPGVAGSDADEFTVVGTAGFAVFRATTAATGREMFRTDGTPGGTRLAVDFRPGPLDGISAANNFGFGVIGNQVVLAATAGVLGVEPWVSDGTVAGSQMLIDIDARANGSAPSDVVTWGERCLFVADDGIHGRELWTTDGTAAGTAMVVDLAPGGTDGAFGAFLRFRDTLLFAGADGLSHGLVQTDGTAAGTGIAVPLRTPALLMEGRVAVLADRLVIADGVDLMVSDGSAGGSRLLRRFQPRQFPPGVAPRELTAFAGRVFFVAEENLDVELWVTDGTAAGTQRFIDLEPSGSSSPTSLTVSNGLLYFDARTVATGSELWVTDGTVAGTRLVRDLNPGPASASVRDVIDADGRLFFRTNSPRSLWTSDGTAAGTRRVVADQPNPAAEIRGMTVFGDRLLFHMSTPSQGREPWISDGTAAGTRQILDVFRFGFDSMFGEFSVVGSGRIALFAADDGVDGVELWRTDGTAGGTYRVTDIAPGLFAASPAHIGRFGATLLFAATRRDVGLELWSLPLLDTGDSLAAPYGFGCPGASGVPRLAGDGAPSVGNAAFAIELERARPTSAGVMLFSLATLQRPLPGSRCLVHPAQPAFGAGFVTDAAGARRVPLAVPQDPALRGTELFTQAFVLDPNGAWANTWAASRPLHLLIGD